MKPVQNLPHKQQSIIRVDVLKYFVLFALIGIGSWIRVSGLSEWIVFGDEWLHIGFSQGTSGWDVFWSIFRNAQPTHPPLVFVLLYYLRHYFNNFESLRVVSLIPGIAFIAIFSLAMERLGGTLCMLCAALLATFSFSLVAYSEIVRSYMLLLCFEAVIILGLVQIHERIFWRGFLIYSIGAIFITLSHFSSLLVLAPISIIWMNSYHRTAGVKAKHALFAWCSLHLACFIFLYIDIFINVDPPLPGEGVKHMLPFLLLFQKIEAVLEGFFLPVNILPQGLFIGLFLLGLVALCRAGWNRFAVTSIAIVLLLIVLGATGHYPLTADRHCAYIIPFLLVPICYSFNVTRIVQFRTQFLCLTGFAALYCSLCRTGGIYWEQPDSIRLYFTRTNSPEFFYKAQDFRAALAFVESQRNALDLLVMSRSGAEAIHFYNFPARYCSCESMYEINSAHSIDSCSHLESLTCSEPLSQEMPETENLWFVVSSYQEDAFEAGTGSPHIPWFETFQNAEMLAGWQHRKFGSALVLWHRPFSAINRKATASG